MLRGAPLPSPEAEDSAGDRPGTSAVAERPAVPVRPEPLRTVFEFELPRGYIDSAGVLHKTGAMRLATARDELLPMYDDRVRSNPAYLTVVLLSRVITRLGTMVDDEVRASVVEQLFASDLAFLQDLYRRINTEGHSRAAVNCPACGERFTVDLAGGGQGQA
jgi:hypothetical protein